MDLCAQRFRSHEIALRVAAISPELLVSCRTVQISQILLNLLSNAHDAVEGTASSVVEIAVDADERHVRIAVLDSGPGVPQHLVPRVMEPFFTTKEVGKGTGLGLSVSRGIAEAHRGSLAYAPRDGRTCFVLTLPRA
jgi:C4-dicarboxylate-specific signal transduction histidine kinase